MAGRAVAEVEALRLVFNGVRYSQYARTLRALFLASPPAVIGLHTVIVKGGVEEQEEGSKSRFNDAEARAVAHCVERLHRQHGIDYSDIGVTTPYADMVKRLQVGAPPGLEIASVASFQGREKPIMIFFMVRTTEDVSYVSDARRGNVAFSRARNGLIVIMSEKFHKQELRALRLIGWPGEVRLPLLTGAGEAAPAGTELPPDGCFCAGHPRSLCLAGVGWLSCPSAAAAHRSPQRRSHTPTHQPPG
jgi:hypothetical protein